MNETAHAEFSDKKVKDSEMDISLLKYQECSACGPDRVEFGNVSIPWTDSADWDIYQDDNLPIGVNWSDIEL